MFFSMFFLSISSIILILTVLYFYLFLCIQQTLHAEHASGDVYRYDTKDDQNFTQCGDFYRMLSVEERDRLTDNIAGNLSAAKDFLQKRGMCVYMYACISKCLSVSVFLIVFFIFFSHNHCFLSLNSSLLFLAVANFAACDPAYGAQLQKKLDVIHAKVAGGQKINGGVAPNKLSPPRNIPVAAK